MDTVVITGASRGLGAAVARAFAAEGAHVVLGARDDDDLAAVADGIREDGGAATALRCDVRDEYDVERLMETAARVDDGVDVLVAGAAVRHGDPGESPLADASYAAFDDAVRTNGRGVFAAIREARPHLSVDARVIVPSCRVAREPTPDEGAYAVSKALAEAVARQFAAGLEIPVGVVDPGTVSTPLSGTNGRLPEEVAPMVVWAAADAPADALDGRVLDRRDWRAATPAADRRGY